MDLSYKIQIAYEAQTDRMIDEMYSPTCIECEMCREYFYSNCALGIKYDSNLDFCSDRCVDLWEETFSHDYAEGEFNNLDNQSSIHPSFCTPNHTINQKD